MKAVFFHDVKMKKSSDGNIYSIGGFSYVVWKRYLEFFDKITVVSRCENIENSEITKYELASGENLSFVCCPSLNSIDVFKNYKRAYEIIKSELENSDAAIIRLPSTIGFLACHIAILQKKPYFVEVVGCSFDALMNFGTFFSKIVAPSYYLLAKHYIRKSPYITYVTNEFLQKRYPNRGVSSAYSDIILNNIDEAILQDRINKIEKGFMKDICFGMIGPLNLDYKGHKTAFYALSKLKNKIPSFKLYLVGSGDYSKWERLSKKLDIEKNVEFCGTLQSYNDILSFLSRLDVFLIPSYTEGMPRALIEAMSVGLPAIGSKVGGIVELLDNSMLFKAKNYKKLASLIFIIINDKNLMKKQAIINFNRAKEFTNKITNKKRADFINDFKNNINF